MDMDRTSPLSFSKYYRIHRETVAGGWANTGATIPDEDEEALLFLFLEIIGGDASAPSFHRPDDSRLNPGLTGKQSRASGDQTFIQGRSPAAVPS